MKVLLVITNISGFHEIPYSFGLHSIAAYIESKGYETNMIAIRNELELKDFASKIRKFNPSVVGFSSVSSQFAHIKRAARIVKESDKNIITLCGGVHTTLYPHSLIESDDLDYVFVGESEVAFGDFLDELKENGDCKKNKNLVFRDGKVIHTNPLHPLIHNLDVLPYPQKSDLFKEFIDTNGFAPFFFSRGCPYAAHTVVTNR